MNKYFKTVILLVSCFLCANLSAQEYGAYNLLSEFDFEGETVVDNLGNIDITATDVEIVWNEERQSNVGYFNSTSKSNIQLNDSPLNGEFTMGFWYQRLDTDLTTNWRMPFAFYAADGSNIYFTPHTSWNDYSYLIVQNKAYSTYTSIVGTTLADEWVHVAVTFSGTTCCLYINGSLTGTATIIGELPDFGTIYHYFGNYPANSYSMTSYMDDIKIYHTALAGNQIVALYNGEEIPELEIEGLPHAKIDFNDGTATDTYSNVDLTVSNVAMTTYDKREVAELSAQSAMTTTTNPFGDEKYTLAMVYNTENKSDAELIDKKLIEFKGAGDDYIEVYLRDGLTLDVVSSIDGTDRTATTTNSLNAGEWNSIVFAQTYSEAGTGAMKVYINGTLGKTAVGVNTATAAITSWTIGSTDGTTTAGAIDEIVIYQDELLTADVTSYHNGTVESIELSIDVTKQYQTIRNFGASDGWNAQPLGLYFAEEKKEEVAEILFSKEMDEDGNPKGIGLSSWRFNIGAGTTEQGDNSRISHEWRRSECFMNADGETYDWSKQAGQVYFLRKAALEYDVEDIIGWQNSPPVLYTKYNLGFREYGESTSATILLDEHYGDFAKFLADVILYFEEEEGIEFKYLSPLNEPQWDWGASESGGTVSQEGSPWSNQNIYDVVSAINTEFQDRDVASKIFIGEAASLNYLLSGSSGHASDQISKFFNTSSSLSLRGMESVAPIMSGHSYFTDTSASSIVNTRTSVAEQTEAEGLEYWQTEYSLLNTGYQFGHESSTLSAMESAISLSRVVHSDLVDANATGWQWWTTFELESNLNTEDRFCLVRIALNADMTDGVYRTTKLLYSFGNFSRFVRPGMVRIDLGRSDNMSSTDQITSQMFSAYMDPETNQVVIVAINASTGDCAITLPEIAIDDTHRVANFTPYITSASDDLKRYDDVAAGAHYVMSGTTVTTFVGEVEEYSSTKEVASKPTISIAPNPASSYVSIQSASVIDEVMVVDMTGRVISSVSPSASQYTINCEAWNKGLYLVVVKSEGTVTTQKLVVK